MTNDDHCQRYSPSQIFDIAFNLISSYIEWSCAVVITITLWCQDCFHRQVWYKLSRFYFLRTIPMASTKYLSLTNCDSSYIIKYIPYNLWQYSRKREGKNAEIHLPQEWSIISRLKIFWGFPKLLILKLFDLGFPSTPVSREMAHKCQEDKIHYNFFKRHNWGLLWISFKNNLVGLIKNIHIIKISRHFG